MKKRLSIAIASVAVLAFLAIVLAISMSNSPQAVTIEQSELSPASEIVFEEKAIEPAEEAAQGDAVFSELSRRYKGTKILIEGDVSDSVTKGPIANYNMVLYCNGKSILESSTNSDGSFAVTTEKPCAAGQEAWISIDYNGKDYESEHLILPKRIIGTGSVSGGSSKSTAISTASVSVGVPEFSTMTLALAVIAGCLGLVLLRKN